MTPKAETQPRRQRLTPEVRRRQIIAAAGEMILKQGHLPLALDRLAQSAGVSKALLYTYFPTQQQLFDAVVRQEFEALRARGLDAAVAADELFDAALACARIYYAHVAETGPLIHIILRDAFMARGLSAEASAFRSRIVRRLAGLARRSLRLQAKENVALLNLLITIPEEAGRLAYEGQLTFDRGLLLCEELVASSLEAFRPQRNGLRAKPAPAS